MSVAVVVVLVCQTVLAAVAAGATGTGMRAAVADQIEVATGGVIVAAIETGTAVPTVTETAVATETEGLIVTEIEVATATETVVTAEVTAALTVGSIGAETAGLEAAVTVVIHDAVCAAQIEVLVAVAVTEMTASAEDEVADACAGVVAAVEAAAVEDDEAVKAAPCAEDGEGGEVAEAGFAASFPLIAATQLRNLGGASVGVRTMRMRMAAAGDLVNGAAAVRLSAAKGKSAEEVLTRGPTALTQTLRKVASPAAAAAVRRTTVGEKKP